MAERKIDYAVDGEDKTIDLFEDMEPTLFIGLGGTGAEVLMRLRRRILSKVWSVGPKAMRLETVVLR